MATYNPKRKTKSGVEDVTFPISAVSGLQDELNKLDGKTIDKITLFDAWAGEKHEVGYEGPDGIVWTDTFSFQSDGEELGSGEIAQRIPLMAGDNVNFPVDEDNQVVKINATPPQTPITYNELKALRDNGELVAGMFYRITDYQCTTMQENTRAMNNQFDIIVQALSSNTLFEIASADYHIGGGTISSSVIESDGVLVEGAVTPYYYEYIDYEGGAGEGLQEYKQSDIFVSYGYLTNNEGVEVPVIYKTDEDYIDEGADYEDIFYYIGTAEVNGDTYDKWRKIVDNADSDLTWDSTGQVYLYTNVIVESGSSGGYFANSNLAAWELKYCLDNDTDRFAWALEGQIITNLETYYSNGRPLVRQPTFDGAEENAVNNGYQYAWGTEEDVNDTDPTGFWYSRNETIADGEMLYNGGVTAEAQVISGKGVIYWIKDEHGNECPYDFKNIQFKRYMITKTKVESISGLVGHYFGIPGGYGYTIDEDDYIWCYTFSWLNENDIVDDLSIVGQHLANDEGQYDGIFDNIINIVSSWHSDTADSPSKFSISLNNIVLLSEYSYEDGMFYGCSSNTFGTNCYSNTLGSCASNIFGDYCSYNTFGSECISSTFGDAFTFNTFDDSSYNIFGNHCSQNILGGGSYSNTFKDFCKANILGNDCNQNIFGNFCNVHIFGSNCNNNIFGSECVYSTLPDYARCIRFENGCKYIKLINAETASSSNYVQDITVSAGVRGTNSAPIELTVSRNAAPVVYRASGSQEVILDI